MGARGPQRDGRTSPRDQMGHRTPWVPLPQTRGTIPVPTRCLTGQSRPGSAGTSQGATRKEPGCPGSPSPQGATPSLPRSEDSRLLQVRAPNLDQQLLLEAAIFNQKQKHRHGFKMIFFLTLTDSRPSDENISLGKCQISLCFQSPGPSATRNPGSLLSMLWGPSHGPRLSAQAPMNTAALMNRSPATRASNTSPDATGHDLVELAQTGKSSAASGRNFQIPGKTPSLKAKPVRKHK